MKARELFQIMEGVDPEAEVVVNLNKGTQILRVNDASNGFVNYTQFGTITQKDYESDFAELHPEFIEGLEQAIVIFTG